MYRHCIVLHLQDGKANITANAIDKADVIDGIDHDMISVIAFVIANGRVNAISNVKVNDLDNIIAKKSQWHTLKNH